MVSTILKLNDLSDAAIKSRFWKGLDRILKATKIVDSKRSDFISIGDLIESIGLDKPTLRSLINEQLKNENDESNRKIAVVL
jgi:hypothetical protein